MIFFPQIWLGTAVLPQVRAFYTKVLNDAERSRLADNIAEHSSGAQETIQKRVADMFDKVHPDLGRAIREGQRKYNDRPGKKFAHL